MLKQLNNSELSQILKVCPMGLALSDNKQNIIWINDTFDTYLGISADEIQGQSINDLPEILKTLFQFSPNDKLEQIHKHMDLPHHQQTMLLIFLHLILHILPNAKKQTKKLIYASIKKLVFIKKRKQNKLF